MKCTAINAQSLLLVGMSGVLSGLAVGQTTFEVPQLLTAGDAEYQLSRNPTSNMAFDSSGNLHLVYWSGGSVTNPNLPSFVYHRLWNVETGWAEPMLLDEASQTETNRHVGGRHPSLAMLPDGSAWIVWQDHRHCTQAGNFIDNIEIYGSLRRADGTFDPADMRLTTSSAGGPGDNGYLPQLSLSPTGRIDMVWYDFLANGPSDIFLKSTLPSGLFDPSETMESMRLTNIDLRGGTPAFAFPHLTHSADDTRYFTWLDGYTDNQSIYVGVMTEESAAPTSQVLATGKGSAFDPPKIATAPDGIVWLLYSDPTVGSRMTLHRTTVGSSQFGAGQLLPTEGLGAATFPDFKFDANGRMHLAWLDNRAGYRIYYGLYDLSSNTMVEELPVTEVGDWNAPALVLDAKSSPYLVFSEGFFGVMDLWFVRSIPKEGSGNAWILD